MLLIPKLTRTLVFGNIFVAACAYFLTLEELYFDGKLALLNPSSLFVFFSTLLIYNYRKLFFADRELSPPVTERAKWIVSNRSTLAIICLTSVFGILISAFNLSGKTLLLLLPLFFISVLYATPFSTKMDSAKRLRFLPYVKIFLVAGVWSTVTVLFPVVENDSEMLFSNAVIFSFITRFIFLFAITLPFDIRDIEVDARNKIKTIPLALGEKNTVRLALAALVLFMGMYGFSFLFMENQNRYKAIGYILSGICSFALISQSSKNKNEYFTSFWIEGLMLLQFICLFLMKIFTI